MTDRVDIRSVLVRWGLLSGAAFATGLVSIATETVAGRSVALNHGFWVVEPFLYLHPTENLRWRGTGPLILVWVATLAGAAALVLFIRGLRKAYLQVPATLEILGGLLIGGFVANDLEIVIKGSVTDFIWVRAAGVYSAGDIAMALGIALLPLAAVQFFSDHSQLVRILIGFGVIATTVVFGLLGHHPGPLVAYFVGALYGVGGLVWLGLQASFALVGTPRRRSRCSRFSRGLP